MTPTRLFGLPAASICIALAWPVPMLRAQAVAKTVTLTSSAFKGGSPIPEDYTDYGKGKSIPLTWTGLPPGTRSVAIVMDDPDAKTPRPFVHWLIYNIPANTRGLGAGLPTKPRLDNPKGALQGTNSKHSIGYAGPRPPEGDPPHHYQIKLYALDQELKLDPGVDEDTLLKDMSGHILGQGQLVGTVQKK
ncbi:MAG: YbhB/YbcL family Raf kinase inhibitor-like protein [Gemmatimonadales bacterium]